MLRLTLGLTFKDTQCSFKAFTRPGRQLRFFRCRLLNAGVSIRSYFISPGNIQG